MERRGGTLRMPLSVGAGAARQVAIGAVAVVPVEWAGDKLYYFAHHWLADGGGWNAGFFLVAGVLLAIAAAAALWVWIRAQEAWNERPSDLLLSPEGVTVEGGPHDGWSVPWSELDREGTRVEHMLFKLRTVGGEERTLGRARFNTEEQSLAALAQTLKESRYDADPEPEEGAHTFACDNCGAPLCPDDADEVECAYCRTKNAVPPELRERIRAARTVRAEHDPLEARVRALLRQPGARRARIQLWIAGGAIIAASLLGLALQIYQHAHTGALTFSSVWSIWLFPLAFAGGAFLLLRASLVDRFALGLLTLGNGARRGPGGTLLCHQCGAALPAAGNKVIVRCVFCEADSVTGVDLRDLARRETGEAVSIARVLSTRRVSRALYGVGGVVLAVPLFAKAGRLYQSGAKTVLFTKTAGSLVSNQYFITDDEAAMTEPAARYDHVLVIQRPAQGNPAVVFCDSMGTAIANVWRAPGLASPAWVDRKRYVVIARDGSEQALHLAPIAGGPGQIIYRAPALSHPSASPAGDRVIVGARLGGHWQLVIVPLAGGAPRALVAGRSPAWHPHSNVVAYIRNVGGHSTLFTVDLDEKPLDPQQIYERVDIDEDDPAWSPCGRWLAYVTNKNWKKYDNGSARTTRNLAALHFSAIAEGRGKWYALTQGSAAVHHPSWAGRQIWSEWDANDRSEVPTVQELDARDELADAPPCSYQGGTPAE